MHGSKCGRRVGGTFELGGVHLDIRARSTAPTSKAPVTVKPEAP